MVTKAGLAFILVAFQSTTIYATERALETYTAILEKRLASPAYKTAADIFAINPKLKDSFKACVINKPKAIVEKSHSLLRKISDLELPADKVNAVSMIKSMCFLTHTKKYLKRSVGPAHDLYIHPSEQYLEFPLQINVRRDLLSFRHARYYFHLKNLDPMGRHGGFKQFSRSIEVKSEEVVANLVSQTEKQGQIANVLNELTTLSAFQGSKLHLKYYNSSIYMDKDQKLQVAFQTPLYTHDLSTYATTDWSLSEILPLALAMSEAVAAMHHKKYAHRDVKPHNFLINTEAKRLDVVLADFGLSLHYTGTLHPSSVPGTRGYKDPALIVKVAGKHPILFEDLCAADVFSLGMSFYRMFINDMELFENNRELNNIDRNKSMTSKDRFLRIGEELTSYLTLYKKQLMTLGKQDPRDKFGRIVYEMIHPDIHDRITINEAIREISDLLQQQKR